MSDGALSQAEIDALLSGGNTAQPASGNTNDVSAIKDYLNGTLPAQSSNLSAMTGGNVRLTGLSVSPSNRDVFLPQLPDMVTSVKIDFTSGFPGEHLFIMSEDAAKAIASVMNKEENISLDAMAMSVIGEVVSQIAGTEITVLTTKTGNTSIAASPPEAANVPKAAVALPPNDFTVASYDVDLGSGAPHKIWEIFGPSVSAGITAALRAGTPGPQNAAGGAGMSGMGIGSPGSFMQPPGVQSIQFPGLSPKMTMREQGNIGLLMDVFMEMTVELGRTRKLIKEILSMGEGTIIELDKLAGEPVDILVNHVPIAKGEVVVIDENFGVRVTEIVSPAERMNELG
ncbi:MAG: flagellar motor switch protein FliN [Spirochaetaceae bacterium]|jgi:flagellar motor switch protein FliN/FliY|nr:flagellar motor switch protein FliN [Spirochaetaceae bacterium]